MYKPKFTVMLLPWICMSALHNCIYIASFPGRNAGNQASYNIIIVQVASLASLAQLLPPRSPIYVSNRSQTAFCAELLLPDCVRFSFCSMIVSSHAISMHPIRLTYCSQIASSSTTAPRSCPLPLLLPDCIRCSSIVSASAAAPRSHLRQLLRCVRFSYICYCSLVVSVCSPSRSGGFQPLSNILDRSSQSSKFGERFYCPCVCNGSRMFGELD